MALTREEALKGPTAKVESVSVPELGGDGHVCIREWLASQYPAIEEYRKAAVKKGLDGRLRAMANICAASICDQEGGLLLDAEDVDALLQWPYSSLDRVAMAALTLNGIDADSGEPEGNLPDGQSESSP